MEQMQLSRQLSSEAQALTESMSNVRELVVSLPDISETVQKTYGIVQRLDRTRLGMWNKISDRRPFHAHCQSADEDRMKILGWLSKVEHHEKHNDTLRRRHGNTGMWFLELAEFQDWLKNDTTNVLWCKGDPGVGKTILAYVSRPC